MVTWLRVIWLSLGIIWGRLGSTRDFAFAEFKGQCYVIYICLSLHELSRSEFVSFYVFGSFFILTVL